MLALFHDGVVVVFCTGSDGRRVWQVCTLRGHSGRVRSIAFSPDGKRVVSGSDDHLVKIWDVEAETEVCTHGGETL